MASNHQRITARLIAEAEEPGEAYARALRVAAIDAQLSKGIIDLLERYAETAALADEAKNAAKAQREEAKALWDLAQKAAQSGPDLADMAEEATR